MPDYGEPEPQSVHSGKVTILQAILFAICAYSLLFLGFAAEEAFRDATSPQDILPVLPRLAIWIAVMIGPFLVGAILMSRHPRAAAISLFAGAAIHALGQFSSTVDLAGLILLIILPGGTGFWLWQMSDPDDEISR